MEDMKKLENPDGISIDFNGKKYLLRGSLASAVGDGLAIHELLGLLTPGGAYKFSRLCLIHRTDFH